MWQNYRFLDLLSVLCVCDNVAIQDNQTYITDHWLCREKVSDHFSFLPLIIFQQYNFFWTQLLNFIHFIVSKEGSDIVETKLFDTGGFKR